MTQIVSAAPCACRTADRACTHNYGMYNYGMYVFPTCSVASCMCFAAPCRTADRTCMHHHGRIILFTPLFQEVTFTDDLPSRYECVRDMYTGDLYVSCQHLAGQLTGYACITMLVLNHTKRSNTALAPCDTRKEKKTKAMLQYLKGEESGLQSASRKACKSSVRAHIDTKL